VIVTVHSQATFEMAKAALEIIFPGRSLRTSIVFGENLVKALALEDFSKASSIAIVTDDIVGKLYSSSLEDRLSQASKTHVFVMKHGERNKSLATVSRIAAQLSREGVDRSSVIVALGGGVVGDLTGFVASIFKRGIRFFQFPTTLLAQVDSSIGGKSGVDTAWGKNQIGTFIQPERIYVDSSVLDTLPEGEVINGLGEIVKSSIIADRRMFDEIDSSVEEYFRIQKLKSLVRRTCEIKAGVVEADEREAGLRKILNYGHTVGHAIESASNYRLSHGKSVMLGMICEGWIAKNLGIFQESDYFRQENLLSKIVSHYQIHVRATPKKILSFALLDKKNASGEIRMSLPEKLGKMHAGGDGRYAVSVSKELLLRSLQNLS
jgi:3-dehydroquinate synthase